MANKRITEDGEVVAIETPEQDIGIGPIFFKTPHNHDRNAESDRTGTVFRDPTRTQQQFKKDSDINEILAKFMQTGELPQVGQARYMDIDTEGDLQDNMVTAHQVNEAWLSLPAAVRNILKNPATFVSYVDHCLETGDLEPLRELGLAKPLNTPVANAQAPEPANPPAAPDAASPDKGPPGPS